MERIEHGKRSFDGLDLVVAHDHEPQCLDSANILERYCVVQNVMLQRT
jgi:hypothetical protein